MKQEDSPTGGRYVLNDSKQSRVEGIGRRIRCGHRRNHLGIGFELYPPRFAFQVAEGPAGCEAKRPGPKRFWMPQIGEILEDRQRDLLQHVVCERCTY